MGHLKNAQCKRSLVSGKIMLLQYKKERDNDTDFFS